MEDWTCVCGRENDGRNPSCAQCALPRPNDMFGGARSGPLDYGDEDTDQGTGRGYHRDDPWRHPVPRAPNPQTQLPATRQQIGRVGMGPVDWWFIKRFLPMPKGVEDPPWPTDMFILPPPKDGKVNDGEDLIVVEQDKMGATTYTRWRSGREVRDSLVPWGPKVLARASRRSEEIEFTLKVMATVQKRDADGKPVGPPKLNKITVDVLVKVGPELVYAGGGITDQAATALIESRDKGATWRKLITEWLTNRLQERLARRDGEEFALQKDIPAFVEDHRKDLDEVLADHGFRIDMLDFGEVDGLESLDAQQEVDRESAMMDKEADVAVRVLEAARGSGGERNSVLGDLMAIRELDKLDRRREERRAKRKGKDDK